MNRTRALLWACGCVVDADVSEREHNEQEHEDEDEGMPSLFDARPGERTRGNER